MNYGPKLFRCFDAWFLNLEFEKFLCKEWKDLPDLYSSTKLKALKGLVKSWSKENFGLMDYKISNLENVIHDLQKIGEERSLDVLEMARLCAAQNHLQSWLLRRERIWRQKAHTYGFSMKDHNTKFFHTSTVFKTKKNEIVQLKIDGRTVHGVSNLKNEIWCYFVERFTQDHILALDFDMGNHPKITDDQVRFLESRPSLNEVKNAV